ncbi:MAG TPA: acetyltransferase, partial [Nevskiaceae bacterium]
ARRSWLLLGNHRSWVDIPLLFDVLGRRMAFPRFFVKEELRWMPVIGFCCWALDMPFMRRHTRAELAANPAAGRDDMEATRRACARFRGQPVTLVNFAEGTRYTGDKHTAQRSPFRHLLRPKSGGLAFAMQAMGDQFAGIIDVTFIYRRTRRGALWGFLCGDQRGMRVHVEVLPIPDALAQRGALSHAAYRARCREWIEALWAAKDARIERALRDGDPDAGA